MSNVPTQKPQAGVAQALSVAAAMEQLRLEAPRGAVTIQGVVSALRPYPVERPTRIYGDLTDMDREYTMSFRCPRGSAPQSLEELVVLHGTLTIEKARHHSGYDLVLIGSKAGNWTPSVSLTETEVIPKVDRPEGLIGALCIHWEPATDCLHRDGACFERCREHVPKEVRCSLSELSHTCLHRSNSTDGPGTPGRLRCSLPVARRRRPKFVRALERHSTDESFVTPSDLGYSYSAALTAREAREDLERQLLTGAERQRTLRAELEAQKALTTERDMSSAALVSQRERAAAAKLKRVALVAVVLGGLLIIAIVVLFVHLS